MDFFIHKIFEKRTDSYSHLQFEKYSRGIFKDKAIVQCKKNKDGFSFVTTSEYASEFVRACAEELDEKKTKVEGVIISTKELPSNIKYKDISQFMGVKKYSISGELNGKEIIQICESVPRAFVALSFSTEYSELKIKPKAPKSAKPGSSSVDGPKVDFCKLKTKNPEFAKKLFFDVEEFKSAEVRHDFNIENIEMDYKEKDPVKMRKNAVRCGKIVRKLTIDGNKKNYEFDLVG
jgi:hypothetical protein